VSVTRPKPKSKTRTIYLQEKQKERNNIYANQSPPEVGTTTALPGNTLRTSTCYGSSLLEYKEVQSFMLLRKHFFVMYWGN